MTSEQNTLADMIQSLLATVNGIIDEYTGREIDLKPSLLNSVNRTLFKCLSLVDALSKLEDAEEDLIEDPEEEDDMDAVHAPISFVLLEQVVDSWNHLKARVDVISQFLEDNPGQAAAHLLDAVVTFAAHSIKFQQMAEHVRLEKERAVELEMYDGCTPEEREMLKAFEKMERQDHVWSADPYSAQHNPDRDSQHLETEDDYRYGMNPPNQFSKRRNHR